MQQPEFSATIRLDQVSPPLPPALDHWIACHGESFDLGQLAVRRVADGWDLRHRDDEARSSETLQRIPPDQLNRHVQTTAQGAFRPLRSAPDLRSGWICRVTDAPGLDGALHAVYPGALADFFAVASLTPGPTTSYVDFVGRQSGRYRQTRTLPLADAARVAAAVCHPAFCLKQRLWPLPGLEPDPAGSKSAIPCLEPCALLLDFATTQARIQSEPPAPDVPAGLTPWDGDTLVAALEVAQGHPDPAMRTADFSHPLNPRRVQFVLEKLRGLWKRPNNSATPLPD